MDGCSNPSGDEVPIACTLAPDQVAGRLDDWQSTIGRASAREPIEGGVRLRFAGNIDVAALARLAAAEHECCRFFTFTIRIDSEGVTFEATAPDDAAPVLEAMLAPTR